MKKKILALALCFCLMLTVCAGAAVAKYIGTTSLPTFTLNINGSDVLDHIEVTKVPSKTVYNDGDDFDATGMVVTAYYTDGTSAVVTDYTVTDGTDLDSASQTSVTISYTEDGITKTTTQPITVNKALPILAANSTWFTQGGTSVTRSSITEIEIKDTYVPVGTEGIDYIAWDASEAKDGSVMAYVEGTKLTIAGNGYGCVYMNADSQYAFSDSNRKDMFTSVQKILGANLLDTSKATTLYGTFYNCSALETIDVSNWDVSNVTNMRGMFYGCHALETLDVSDWDVSNVTTMRSMFCGVGTNAGAMKLKELDVRNWETGSVTDMSGMFYGCGQLTEMDLSNWDVSNVTTMSHMFADCFKMESYNFSGWNTASLTDIGAMFNDNNALTFIDVSDFDTGNVTVISQIFEYCNSLSSIAGLEKWDVSKVISFQEVFSGCSSLTELDLTAWDTSSVQLLYRMFFGGTVKWQRKKCLLRT